MKSITSANVAAGFHAGNHSVMRETVRLAASCGVAVGAHPGFPDRDAFGRRELDVTPAEVEDLVLYQIAAVAGVAAAEGLRLQHVKPHGALYNMSVRDQALASAIDRSLILFAPPGSALLAAGRRAGLRVAAEVFADRAYERDGSLASRSAPGALVEDGDMMVRQAVRMVKDWSVVALDGTIVPLEADTICIHGDTAGSDVLAAALRAGLEASGILVSRPDL
jgi:UPF0271 protein